jgi:hypothetical protein
MSFADADAAWACSTHVEISSARMVKLYLVALY